MQKVFKYKLDFYYQQTLIYLLVFLIYAVVRGSFVENQFSLVLKDPIVYIMMFFVLISLGTLLLNRYRNRMLIVEEDRIIFHSRHRDREIKISAIEWMHIGREMLVQTAGRFQMVVMKIRGRRRLFRIRVGRYERDRELIGEMERIADRVPKGKGKGLGMHRRKPV